MTQEVQNSIKEDAASDPMLADRKTHSKCEDNGKLSDRAH